MRQHIKSYITIGGSWTIVYYRASSMLQCVFQKGSDKKLDQSRLSTSKSLIKGKHCKSAIVPSGLAVLNLSMRPLNRECWIWRRVFSSNFRSTSDAKPKEGGTSPCDSNFFREMKSKKRRRSNCEVFCSADTVTSKLRHAHQNTKNMSSALYCVLNSVIQTTINTVFCIIS